MLYIDFLYINRPSYFYQKMPLVTNYSNNIMTEPSKSSEYASMSFEPILTDESINAPTVAVIGK